MAAGPCLLNMVIEDFAGRTLNEIDIPKSLEVLKEMMGPLYGSFEPTPSTSGCCKTSNGSSSQNSSFNSSSKKEFKVRLDVKNFKPEELKITADEDTIIVEGKHEERADEDGSISRQFTRKYRIPEDVDKMALTSKLSPDGFLTLQAPKKIKDEEKTVFEIPITHTNQPVNTQENQPTQPQEDSQSNQETN